MLKMNIEDDETAQGSLRGKVFLKLENDILEGIYKNGDSLNESKLTKELGVSRTPIREAIRQLELEGLVVSTPNKGAIVKGLTNEDIEDVFRMRVLIEGIAARRAAENITQEQIDNIKEIIDFEEFYTKKNDSKQLMKLDIRFHYAIFKASKSWILRKTLSSFQHYVRRAKTYAFASPQRSLKIYEEHKAIMGAIIEGNADEAERLTVQHIKNATANYISK